MIKTGPIGGYDDDQFSDEARLYRRVPDKPDYLKVIDPVTGEKRPTPAAFSIKDEPDGLSISIEILMRRHKLPTRNLCRDWNTHGVARFSAGLVRPSLGVISAPTDEQYAGKAHGLVRGPDGIPSRGTWNTIRSKILEHAVYFDSDPDPPTGIGALVLHTQRMFENSIAFLTRLVLPKHNE